MTKIILTSIPTPENFQILDIQIGGNGRADYLDLALLRLPPELDFAKGVVVNGVGPIWLHAHLVFECSSAAWIAVFDPRLPGAVVVGVGDAGAPTLGSKIGADSILPHLPTSAKRRKPGAPDNEGPPDRVVAFVGPPHSGKSVLVSGLRAALQEREPNSFQRETFLLRACPDGEGNWFSEIPLGLAVTLRFKKEWDEGFVRQVCEELEALAKIKRLVLVDVGGKIDARNARLLARCTHAVIVSKSAQGFSEWRAALQAVGVKVLAEVESVRESAAEIGPGNPPVFRLGPLDRGAPVPLPRDLVDLF